MHEGLRGAGKKAEADEGLGHSRSSEVVGNEREYDDANLKYVSLFLFPEALLVLTRMQISYF